MAKLPDGWVFIPKPVKRTTIDIEQHELVMCRNCKHRDPEDLNWRKTGMNGLSIEELITKAREEKVRIEVEITPDEYGRVIQRITIEPWKPIEYVCPHMVGVKRGNLDEID